MPEERRAFGGPDARRDADDGQGRRDHGGAGAVPREGAEGEGGQGDDRAERRGAHRRGGEPAAKGEEGETEEQADRGAGGDLGDGVGEIGEEVEEEGGGCLGAEVNRPVAPVADVNRHPSVRRTVIKIKVSSPSRATPPTAWRPRFLSAFWENRLAVWRSGAHNSPHRVVRPARTPEEPTTSS